MNSLRALKKNDKITARLEKSRAIAEASDIRYWVDIFWWGTLSESMLSRTAYFEEFGDADTYIKHFSQQNMVAFWNGKLYTENLSGALEEDLIDKDADKKVRLERFLTLKDEYYASGEHYKYFELEAVMNEKYIHKAKMDRFDNFLTEAGELLHGNIGKSFQLEFTSTKGTDNNGFHHITRITLC